jgi:hypothetical protein
MTWKPWTFFLVAIGSSCASPPVKVRGKQGVRLQLEVDFRQGRRHLPVVTLKRVA